MTGNIDKANAYEGPIPEICKDKRVFTDEEIYELSCDRIPFIKKLVQDDDRKKALDVFNSWYESITFLHDGAFCWIAGLLTWIYERHGIRGVAEADEIAYRRERADVMPPEPQVDFDMVVRSTAKALRGICKQQFTVTEDKEKVTFELTPCGTGGRLIRLGYEDDKGFAMLKGPDVITFSQEELPVYCAHCAVREIVEAKEEGCFRVVHACSAVKPPKDENCKIYVYKDPDTVPSEYYERLKLDPPNNRKFSVNVPEKVFTEKELIEMSSATEDLLQDAIINDSEDKVFSLLDRFLREKTYMHDGVSSWVGSLLTWIYERHGLEGVEDAERFAHGQEGKTVFLPKPYEGFKKEVISNIGAMQGHVYQPIAIIEDDEKITVRVNPCGSGGRTIMRAYDPDRGYARLRGPAPVTWGEEELPIYCVHCPVLEMMAVDRAGTLTVCHSFASTESPKSQCCEYLFYKDPADIPEEYYTRIGYEKPANTVVK